MCEHNFVQSGIVHEDLGLIRGSDSRYRKFYIKYYCTKCLESRYKFIENGSSYNPKYRSLPARIYASEIIQ